MGVSTLSHYLLDPSSAITDGIKHCNPKTALIVEVDTLIALAIEGVTRSKGYDRFEICSAAKAAVESLAKLVPELLVRDAGLVDRDDG